MTSGVWRPRKTEPGIADADEGERLRLGDREFEMLGRDPVGEGPCRQPANAPGSPRHNRAQLAAAISARGNVFN